MKYLFALICLTLTSTFVVGAELPVLVWNVQRGANNFESGPEKTLKVIRESGAEIVLMQESYDIDGERPQLGLWLAKQLGWNAHQGDSPHLCILTKHEISETFTHEPWHGLGVRVKTAQGFEFLAWSCWIDYRAYVPYFLRDNPNATLEQVLKCETKDSNRVAQTEALLARLKELGHLESKLPLLVGGDWNSPSHLDYTESTKDRHRGLVIPFPSSLAFEKAGFTDTFRTVYPDPVKNEGNTWSPLSMKGPQDRIDRLYLRAKDIKAASAKTLPENLEDEAIPQKERQFPSDHAAVLTRLTLSQ